MTELTVIVCTRDRADDLEATCRSLMAIAGARSDVEILVVDNGSTDRTAELLADMSAETARLQAILEPSPGLSRARNAGIRTASGEYLLFLDDDALPAEGWLESLVDGFADSRIWAAGGPIDPVLRGGFPDWFSARFLPYLSAWDRGGEEVDLTYNEYPRGANMAFRRKVFDELGLFLPQLGRRGGSLRSCEEIELMLRIERAGHLVRYLPRARVSHKVETARLTKSWMKKRFFAQGLSEAILEWRHGGMRALRVGFERGRATVKQLSSTADTSSRLLSSCQTSAVRGYVGGMLLAPLTTRKFDRTRSGKALPAWEPPS